MRRHRTDLNQAEIVNALRQKGVQVCVLSGAGGGVPDLLCSVSGRNVLVEVKNLSGRGSRFTPAENEFLRSWQGEIHVVTSPEQALNVLGIKEG